MKPESAIWQVSTQGEVYQADLETLKEWIVEGLVRPEDMVRKGSLGWIEAGRAPLLRRVFTGEETVVPRPRSEAEARPEATPHAASPVAAAPVAHGSVAAPSAAVASFAAPGVWAASATPGHVEQPEEAEPFLVALTPPVESVPTAERVPAAGPSCLNHTGVTPEHICRECASIFCRECVRTVGMSSVALCPACGELCRPYAEVRQRREMEEQRGTAFGLADFRAAILYPFRHRISLVFGACLYGLLLLTGWRGRVLAFAVLFGCISLVINRVCCGWIERDFLPDFSNFNFYDDVLMPALLGLGVTIVSFGPFILLTLALLFGWVSGIKARTPPADARIQRTQELVRERVRQETQGQLSEQDINALSSGNAEQQARVTERQSRQSELDGQQAESPREPATAPQAAQSAREEEHESADGTLTLVRALLERPGLVLLLTLLAGGWAVLYYPMALAVAGYTEDFKSVINPLVGLDTIRRMGATYAKAFGMYIVVQLAVFLVGMLVALVTAPFNMPFFGNIPAIFLNGAVTFYGSLVTACILGLALFKSADRLGIELD